jgi:hypothetical protein
MIVIGTREMPSLEFLFILVSVEISFDRYFISVDNAAPIFKWSRDVHARIFVAPRGISPRK